jgi:hypothetical protein
MPSRIGHVATRQGGHPSRLTSDCLGFTCASNLCWSFDLPVECRDIQHQLPQGGAHHTMPPRLTRIIAAQAAIKPAGVRMLWCRLYRSSNDTPVARKVHLHPNSMFILYWTPDFQKNRSTFVRSGTAKAKTFQAIRHRLLPSKKFCEVNEWVLGFINDALGFREVLRNPADVVSHSA